MDKGLVEVWLGSSLVGRIALISEGLCAFEYDSKFLERGFSISPYVLPLQKKDCVRFAPGLKCSSAGFC